MSTETGRTVSRKPPTETAESDQSDSGAADRREAEDGGREEDGDDDRESGNSRTSEVE